MRSILFFVSAIAVGVAAGAFLFRANNPAVWNDTLAKVERAPWAWAKSVSPFAPSVADEPLLLRLDAALAPAGRYTAVPDPGMARLQRPDLAPEMALAGLSLRPAQGLEAGSVVATLQGRAPYDGLPSPSAGVGLASAETRAGADDRTAALQGVQPERVALSRDLRRPEVVAMRPAEAKGQPVRVDRELASLGPNDLDLNFFPGSRLQPGQSLKSFDSRTTTTSVTLTASAPLSEVAAFYRTQFNTTAADRTRVQEMRAGPGELAFSDSSRPGGDRRAYLFQTGDTVLITLVRTQPGVVR